MGRLYIQEYEGMSRDPTGLMVPVGKEPAITNQVVDTDAVTSAQSAAFQETTAFVRIVATDDVHVSFGTDPAATTSDMPVGASQAEYFGVRPGQGYRIAAIEGSL